MDAVIGRGFTETPARSITLRTRAYEDAKPIDGAEHMNLRRRPSAQCYRVSSVRKCLPARCRRVSSVRRCLPAHCRRVSSLRRRPTAQRRREQALTETPDRSMPSRKQLTETPDCSTAPRTSAYGDARLLNGAEHRGCWGLLKANPRRIPHPCPRSQRKAGKGVFFLHLARKLPDAPR